MYEERAERATVLHGDGFAIRVAALDDIIRAKERANRPKDQQALPELRRLSRADERTGAQPPSVRAVNR